MGRSVLLGLEAMHNVALNYLSTQFQMTFYLHRNMPDAQRYSGAALIRNWLILKIDKGVEFLPQTLIF